MKINLSAWMCLVLAWATIATAQPPLFTDAFPLEEFAERRTRVMGQIGDAVVLIQGATEIPGYMKFRQNNQRHDKP